MFDGDSRVVIRHTGRRGRMNLHKKRIGQRRMSMKKDRIYHLGGKHVTYREGQERVGGYEEMAREGVVGR